MEKIKLFAKKNTEEKDDRKLIERIGDWVTDMDNFPLVTYGIGIGVGLGCGYLLGHTFGKSAGKAAQAAKDAKEFDEFLKCLDDGFKRMQPKYINFDDIIKIDAIKGVRPSLKITGLDIYGKPITKIIGTDVQTAKKLADDLSSVTEEITNQLDANAVADYMRAVGMKNVQVF